MNNNNNYYSIIVQKINKWCLAKKTYECVMKKVWFVGSPFKDRHDHGLMDYKKKCSAKIQMGMHMTEFSNSIWPIWIGIWGL